MASIDLIETREPRVRVLVDREMRWMTLDAARVMHNYLARRRMKHFQLPQDSCSQGHPYSGSNFREYHYGGYIHRTCMICARARARKAKGKQWEQPTAQKLGN